MNPPIATSAMRFAGPVAASPQAQPIIRPLIWRMPFPIHPISLPLASSRSGNLFTDRNDPNLHWYQPQFALAADVDTGFSFAANQASQQSDGTPFNAAHLAFRLTKSMPSDVAQFVQANLSATLQEISLNNLSAVLTSPYTDTTGQPATRSFTASSITPQADGSYLLTFDGSILGQSVVALYQDLRLFGKASIKITATFQTWSAPGAPPPPLGLKATMLCFHTVTPPSSALSNFAVMNATQAHAAVMTPALRTQMPPFRPFPIPPPDPVDPPAPPQLVEGSLPFEQALAIGLKYNADGYQLQYTVTTLDSPSRVILSVADLIGFNAPQSQYVELKELGSLNARYPSISNAYIGVLSRCIVLIPQRYSILRSKAGCAASCVARVDSSPSSTSQCAFELSFVLAPEINRIELAQLQNEVATIADLQGYSITFPSLLKDTPASTLQTSFASAANYTAGSDPHTFSLTVTVQDNGPDTPAVANANLFILRLTAQTDTDLIGALSLKLDDGFTDPVLATVDLNFAHTTGSNELTADLDPTSPAFNLSNLSPLDLVIQEYALAQLATVTNISEAFVLPAQSGKSLPTPVDNAGMTLITAAQLALPTPMSMAAVANYLNFQTVDVQQTRYMVAIDASGVAWKTIASISVTAIFPTLPSIAPMTFALAPMLQSASQSVLIPLVNAMSTLPGSLDFVVSFADTTKVNVEFTLENDFVKQPVMTLLQSTIATQLPAS